jgi:hypothetical protein
VKRSPDTVIVIDHLKLSQPNQPPLLAEPWGDMPRLPAWAAYDNVRVKIGGACSSQATSASGGPSNDLRFLESSLRRFTSAVR